MAPTKFEQFCGPDPGDVDGINGVDVTDALLVAKYTQGQDLPTAACDTRIAFGCADVNADGATDVLDALLIARAFVGLADLVWRTSVAAPTTAMPTTEAPTFARSRQRKGPPTLPQRGRQARRRPAPLPTYEPSAQPRTLWDPSPAPTAPSCDSSQKSCLDGTENVHTVRTNRDANCPLDGALVSALCPAKLRAYDLAPTEPPSRRPYSPTWHPSAAPSYATPLPSTATPTTQSPSVAPTWRRIRASFCAAACTFRHGPRFRSRPPGPCRPSYRPTPAPLHGPDHEAAAVLRSAGISCAIDGLCTRPVQHLAPAFDVASRRHCVACSVRAHKIADPGAHRKANAAPSYGRPRPLPTLTASRHGTLAPSDKLGGPRRRGGDHFGYSVAIDGDTVVVGATGAGTGGAVYVSARPTAAPRTMR